MNRKFIKTKSAGYTILETMIAVSLFLVVVSIGMNALLNASNVHQKSQDLRSILDNLSFVMEDMSRNMRTGYSYHCFLAGDTIPTSTSAVVSTPKSCSVGWAVAFEAATGSTSNNDDQWVYYEGSGHLYKATQGPYASSAFVQLTPDEVVIDSISPFSVLGAEAPAGSDSQQPLGIIKIAGRIVYKGVNTPFTLQTSVSQRLLDR